MGNIQSKNIDNSQINQYLELAKCYLDKQDYINATAIYNFALALCKNQNTQEEELQSCLAQTETDFLNSFKTSTEQIECDTGKFTKRTEYYQEILRTIRTDTKRIIADYSNIISTTAPHENVIAEAGDYQSKVQEIYRDCNEKLKIFTNTIITDSKDDLQSAGLIVPYNCNYAIIALGSLSRSEATPYSDLEFGILIDDTNQETKVKYTEEEQAEIKKYFRNLTRLINIRVLNLGETTPFIQDIPEVNDLDFKPPIQNGLSFDSRRGIACKNPLGNGHVVERELAELEKNNFLSEQEKDAQKKKIREGHFELIGTPRELAKFHNQEWFLRDNHITTALFTTDILEANNAEKAQRIIEQYHQEKDQILDQDLDGITLRKQRSLLLLQEAAKQFEPSGGRLQKGGRTLSPKYDLYRMANLIIDRLTYMHNVKENNVWDRFEKLFVKSEKNPNPPLPITTQEGQNNLKWMLDRTMQIRLNNYMAKGTQDEDMVMWNNPNNETEDPINEGIGITEDELFNIYYVMLPFHEESEKFIHGNESYQDGLYYDDGPINKSSIYRKLLKYDSSIELLRGITYPTAKSLNNLACLYFDVGKSQLALENIKAAIEKSNVEDEDINLITTHRNNLGEMYKRLGEYTKAEEILKENVTNRKNLLPNDLPNLAVSLNNLGDIYNKLGKYKDAFACSEEALDNSTKISGKNAATNATYLSNIGLSQEYLKKYNKAEECYKKALEICKRSFGTDHIETANTTNSLGYLYVQTAEEDLKRKNSSRRDLECQLQQGKDLIISSLEIRIAHLPENSPDIAKSVHDLGYALFAEKNYEPAIKCLEKALRIRKQTLGENNPILATNYNNLGRAYAEIKEYLEAYKSFEKSLNIHKEFKNDEKITMLTKSCEDMGSLITEETKLHTHAPKTVTKLQLLKSEYSLQSILSESLTIKNTNSPRPSPLSPRINPQENPTNIER